MIDPWTVEQVRDYYVRIGAAASAERLSSSFGKCMTELWKNQPEMKTSPIFNDIDRNVVEPKPQEKRVARNSHEVGKKKKAKSAKDVASPPAPAPPPVASSGTKKQKEVNKSKKVSGKRVERPEVEAKKSDEKEDKKVDDGAVDEEGAKKKKKRGRKKASESGISEEIIRNWSPFARDLEKARAEIKESVAVVRKLLESGEEPPDPRTSTAEWGSKISPDRLARLQKALVKSGSKNDSKEESIKRWWVIVRLVYAVTGLDAYLKEQVSDKSQSARFEEWKLQSDINMSDATRQLYVYIARHVLNYPRLLVQTRICSLMLWNSRRDGPSNYMKKGMPDDQLEFWKVDQLAEIVKSVASAQEKMDRLAMSLKETGLEPKDWYGKEEVEEHDLVIEEEDDDDDEEDEEEEDDEAAPEEIVEKHTQHVEHPKLEQPSNPSPKVQSPQTGSSSKSSDSIMVSPAQFAPSLIVRQILRSAKDEYPSMQALAKELLESGTVQFPDLNAASLLSAAKLRADDIRALHKSLPADVPTLKRDKLRHWWLVANAALIWAGCFAKIMVEVQGETISKKFEKFFQPGRPAVSFNNALLYSKLGELIVKFPRLLYQNQLWSANSWMGRLNIVDSFETLLAEDELQFWRHREIN